jgi:2-polyprenyl-3-methyl-5-hydroxy-6-metoxy-1,4-benzoquinol methylase
VTKRAVGVCNACGRKGEGAVVLTKIDAHESNPISLVRCPFCGAVYMQEQAFDPTLYDYYDWYLGRTKEEVFDPITRKRYLALLQQLGSRTRGRRVIDIGCGKGDFIDAALSAGWSALGVELSPAAAKVARQFDLPVVNRDVFLPSDDLGTYDLLTMFEVIEHVERPARLLQRAEELVRPGGLVYVTTPNFDSLDRRFLGPRWAAVNREHLTYLTPRTLRELVARHTNLNLVELSTRNVSVGCLMHIRSLFSGRRKVETNSMTPQVLHDYNAKCTADYRQRIESAGGLRRTRDAVNSLLNLTSLGESMVALLVRPENA